MHFKTNGRDVWNWRFQVVDLKFEDADLCVATKIATDSLASVNRTELVLLESNFDSMINSSHS